MNAKRVERIWRREGLKVPAKQRRRRRLWLNDGSCLRLRPECPNHVWACDVVEDRTKVTFVRVHLGELADDMQHEAEKLQDAEAKPDLVEAKRRAVALAKDIDAALGDLRVAPSDRRVARDVERRLDALQRRADKLAEEL